MFRFAIIALTFTACAGCSTNEADLPAPSAPARESMSNTNRPASGTVESLLEEVAAIPDLTDADAPTEFSLWVPESLTLRGDDVAGDVSMALVLDALLAKDFFPDGFDQGDGGRLYKYKREL